MNLLNLKSKCNIDKKKNNKINYLHPIKIDENLYYEKCNFYKEKINDLIYKIEKYKYSDGPISKGKIQLENYETIPSLLDNLGKILIKDNKIYRGIYSKSQNYFIKLWQSGILQVLSNEGMIPKTKITNFYNEEFDLIIEHEFLDILNPYFWSFSQYKAVALNTLCINKVINHFGYSLIDGHCNNSTFINGRAVFFDIGSFIPNSENKNCELEVFNYQILQLLFSQITKSLLMHKFHSFAWNDTLNHKTYIINSFEYKILLENILNYHKKNSSKFTNKLLTKIFKDRILNLADLDVFFNYNPKNTLWGNYALWTQEDLNNIAKNGTERFNKLALLIKKYSSDAKTVIDLAGNSGFFLNYLSTICNFEKYISADYDEDAIEYGLKASKNNDSNLTFALLNFVLPQSLDAFKEFKSDIVIALAVTHHLLLTQKYEINSLFEIIKSYMNKYIYIEFCPLGLYSSEYPNKTPEIPDWYNEEWFEKNFNKHFYFIKKEVLTTVLINNVETPHRILYIGKLK